MGVQGLWPVLEPAGHPVTLESLEGKRLAIDVSIWLHQAAKGAGAHQLNARNPHLALLLNRLAKLLFYRIRPVFVFDGSNIPPFKKRILAERRVKRDLDTLQLSKAQKKALEVAALSAAARKSSSDHDDSRDQFPSAPYASDDLFHLPSTSQSHATVGEPTSSDDDDPIAELSSDFDTEISEKVPAELRVEMLLDAQERAKDARLRPENLPSNAVNFSRFQMERLLKRKRATARIDRVKKQIVGTFSNGRSGDVKMVVFQGRTRGHVIQVDDENHSASQTPDTAWPDIAAHMPSRVKPPPTEDVDLQLAIEASLLTESVPTTSRDVVCEEVRAPLRRRSPAIVDVASAPLKNSPPRQDQASSSNTFVNTRPDISELVRDGWSSSDEGDFLDVSDPESDIILLSDNSTRPAKKHSSPSVDENRKLTESGKKNEASTSGDDADTVNDDYYRRATPEIPSAGESLAEAIYADCQQLLRLCGVPFVVAPSEAEAQCAHLEQLKLVNGTVSDDSDVWLFGASTVYRHMFDRRKHVQCFSQTDIQRSLGLTRKEMIQVAMLSGADYTTGFEGVGVVTALELIAEFAPKPKSEQLDDGLVALQAIADWRTQPAPTTESSIRRRLRKVISSGRAPSNFPDALVYDAYAQPNVDKSTESFRWGRPDGNGLKRFVWDKLGWPEEKCDSVMKAAFERWGGYLDGAPLQTRITSFTVRLHKDGQDMKLASTARVQSALKRLQKAAMPTESAVLVDQPSESLPANNSLAQVIPKVSKKKVAGGVKKRPKRKAAAKVTKEFQISESSSSGGE